MNKENLANGLLASAVSTSATSATLQSGYGGTMPAVPFKLTVTPFGQLSTKGNSEIWLVTARSGEVLTITRGQDGTTAKAFVAGDIVANGVYVADFLGGNSFVQKETPTGLVNGTNNAFTTSQPYAPGSLMVYVNGLPQFQFATESSPTTGGFTIEDAPLTGDFVRVSYQTSAARFGSSDMVDGYHANATPTPNNLLPLGTDGTFPVAALGGAFKTWTPVFDSITIGNGALVGRYAQFGKFIYCYVSLLFGSTTSISAASGVMFSLPVKAKVDDNIINNNNYGGANLGDVGTGNHVGHTRLESSTKGRIVRQAVTGSNITNAAINNVSPFTWAAGDMMQAYLVYEAA